ncbi:MAG TPA: hypothetical protein VHZ25_07430 [Acidobacteriaceae bacterium]|jgi:hypothetical protein|nr:hypothetical protein [Acidobacteriaceae bacterium]
MTRTFDLTTFDLAREYGSRSDNDLLRLIRIEDQLTPESRAALHAELEQRGLRADRNHSTPENTDQALAAYCRTQPGAMFFVPHMGIGRSYFWKSHSTVDRSTGMEVFEATVFLVLFWVPLIPLGTWRMRRKAGVFPARCEGVDRLPLDWHQIRVVWSVAGAALFALFWGAKLLPYLMRRL